jgi:uncharacterized protein
MPGGQLAGRVMHFARLLRGCGLALGTDRLLLAEQALQHAGLAHRDELRTVLRCCLLDRIEHAEVFDRAFALFWPAPGVQGADEVGSASLLQPPAAAAPADEAALEAPLHDAGVQTPGAGEPEAPSGEPVFAPWLATDHERLRRLDAEAMTEAEWQAATALLARMRPVGEALRTRRFRPAAHPGRLDWRETLRRSARSGGEILQPRWREPRTRPPPLVVLADISGSMSTYTRLLLHLVHLLGRAQPQVESFVFGTRLTRITRLLARRDARLAITEVMHAVQDWSGGTRISASLHRFNRDWARRVLPGHGTVLLITDGLERADPTQGAALGDEMARLSRSCRRLVWLNPLLRFEGFQPLAGGVKAMLPHVDAFVPAHNLHSLEALLALLAEPAGHPAPGLTRQARARR